ncbi:MAG TPA: glycosyltransferase family 1 protein [Candidatus Dormibacteraeota bacterium]|nr:glycosyltransferase family 1 protein [Candidatus Dormibacteraeota bacterium]
MRIGLDARFSSARYDGVGRYVAALLHELLLLPDAPDTLAVWPRDDDPPRHPLPSPGGRLTALRPRRGGRPESPWAQLELPLAARRAHLDVWHSPFPAVPLLVPAPVVVTHHDCIPERFPQYFTRAQRAVYRGGVWTSARRARLVITPSRLSAEDLTRFYGVRPERIRVVPHGVDMPPDPEPDAEQARRTALGVADGYVLIVGRPRPHKGYTQLLRALSQLPASQRPAVVRVGRPDPRLPDGSEAEASRGGVAFTALAGIDDADLLALYRGATLVAVPSAVEGFGFPLLEALAAGAPVLASDIQPLREVGAQVARYLPSAATDWPAALAAALGDSGWQRAARSAGPERAREFPWRNAAQRTLAVYRDAAA